MTLAASPIQAADIATQEFDFDIPAQSLASALLTFSAQTGLQVITAGAALPSRGTSPITGRQSIATALGQLLNGTGLKYQTIGDTTITLVPEKQRTSSAGQKLHLAEAASASATNTNDQSNDNTASSAAGAESIVEIIVTATKRTERLQDVPISMAVLGQQEIERRGLIGMEDYLRSIPGVSQIDQGATSNAIIIRGITTSPELENFNSGTTVASYFDETPITGAAGVALGGIDLRPVDIERIEILRGPQGTTFGDASLGGTFRMIPVKPQLDGFSTRIAASYSNTSGLGSGNSRIQGVLNVPVLADKLAIRAVGYRFDDSGFYRNVAGSDAATLAAAEAFGIDDFVRGHAEDDVGRMLSTGGRLAALWNPTEKLSVSFNFLTQTIEQDGSAAATLDGFNQARFPVAPQGRLRGEHGEVTDTEIDLTSLVLNYAFEWADLTSAVSWVDGGSGAATTSNGLPLISTTALSDFKSFTAETRLASHLDGPFQFLAGVFYSDVDDQAYQTADWPGAPGTAPGGTDPMYIFDIERQLDQRALFGEVSYDLTDKVTATVGARYFEYDKDERTIFEGGVVGVPFGTGAPTLQSTESNSSLKANLSYKPTPDSLLYALWSEGFRLGRPAPGLASLCDTDSDGLIDGSGVSMASTRSIDSDSLENFEIGGKFTLLERRLVIDTSIYRIKWDGLPVAVLAPGCNLTYVANAGAATSDGLEFQASFVALPGLRFDFGAGYTKAELSNDVPQQGWREGARLPGSPKINANLAAQYDFDVAGRNAFVRADALYTGAFYGDILESAQFKAGDYVKLDARAGVEFSHLSVELFVRNLTNEDAFTWRSPVFQGASYLMRPRTVGIQLGYLFE